MADATDSGPRASPGDVTLLLRRCRDGDPRALEALLPLVYDQLRRLAHRLMRGERAGATLQTTEVVHEAYMRLAGSNVSWEDRAHFMRIAAGQMRHFLVDRARARKSAKRGGGVAPIPLDEALHLSAAPATDLLDLDAALTRLARLDPRKGQVIELHLFAGLTHDEIAEVLGFSTPTVERDLRFARAWLCSDLRPAEGGGE